MSIDRSLDISRPDTLLLAYTRKKNQLLVRTLITQKREIKHDRLLGCVIGLAIGDVLGCPLEGMSFRDIQAQYRYVEGLVLTSPGRHWRLPGLHSDDTQQALAVLEAITIEANRNNKNSGQAEYSFERRVAQSLASIYVHGALVNPDAPFGCWRGTGKGFRNVVQRLSGNQPSSNKSSAHSDGSRRGIFPFSIGRNSAQPPSQKQMDSKWAVSYGEPSAGLGAAMRMPPVGTLGENLGDIAKLVATTTLITHTDPLAIISACSIAFACRMLRDETPHSFDATRFLSQLTVHITKLEQSLENFLEPDIYPINQTQIAPINSSLTSLLTQLISAEPRESMRALAEHNAVFTGQRTHPTEGFGPLGVAASLYFFVHAPQNPKQSLFTSINAGGDTDTIGAIVGALCGTLHGPAAFQDFLPDLVALELVVSKVQAVMDHSAVDVPDLVTEESFLTSLESSTKTTLDRLGHTR